MPVDPPALPARLELGELSEELSHSHGFLLNKAAERIAAEFELALRPYGISPREYGILSLIHSRGPQSQQRIGKLLGIDRTTMVNVVDHLEQAGLVIRFRDLNDRRRYAVTLSEKGETLLTRDLVMINEVAHNTFLSRLEPAERDQLLDMLMRLVAKD